jgi:hypothetical protein
MTSATIKAQLVFPIDGATGLALPAPFLWTSVANADAYYLYVGSSPGANDLVNSGETLSTSYQVGALAPGVRVYIRLWTKFGGIWRYVDASAVP